MSNKASERWKFVLEGLASIVPEFNELGEVEYMLVETQYSATRCYSPEEVDTAIDIAMHQINLGYKVWVH